jgi:glycosyltransferase involved in cell wall biosynthesis
MTGPVSEAENGSTVWERLRVLVLEPYYGGSHKAVLDGLLERLDIDVDMLTLPARKWKWRMRGSAITMAAQARELHDAWRAGDLSGRSASAVSRWDLIYASTFVNLAEFYGMAGECVAGTPSIVYFHENQLVYPNRNEEEWDFQFPLTNITSALTADVCAFNSEFTRDTFVAEIPAFMKRFPDRVPKGLAEKIAAKATVVPPPFDPSPFDEIELTRGPLPRIVWPHRWEHDKNPESFFETVLSLAAEGLDFEVAVAGQTFQDRPEVFDRVERELGDRLVHIGEPGDRAEYARLLRSSDITVSTAVNEFLGLAMLEAAYAGCYPLVPDRLVYPEIYPDEYRYASDDQLAAKLRSLIVEGSPPDAARDMAASFTFDEVTPAYAELFEKTARSGNVSA